MDRFVLDASVTMTWCFPDENESYAYSVLDALGELTAAVPSLWPVEVANAIVNGERRQRLPPADATRFLQLISNLPIRIDTQTVFQGLRSTLALAREYGLSAYDASYLELAMRGGLSLATLNERLKNAAKTAGVSLFESVG